MVIVCMCVVLYLWRKGGERGSRSIQRLRHRSKGEGGGKERRTIKVKVDTEKGEEWVGVEWIGVNRHWQVGIDLAGNKLHL